MDWINQLMSKTEDRDRQNKLKEIRILIQRINPAPWKGKSEEAQARIRNVHRNHWHVNYNPDLLGDEAHGLHRTNAYELADRIEDAFRALNSDSELWLEIVKD